MVFYAPAEDHGRNDKGHEHHGEHAHNGDLSQGMEGWMTGYDERTDTNEHDTSRQEDGTTIGGQHRPTVGVLIDSTLGHEDGIVVALSKDKGAQDDVDDIKLYAQQRHNAQDPQPADGHGEE